MIYAVSNSIFLFFKLSNPPLVRKRKKGKNGKKFGKIVAGKDVKNARLEGMWTQKEIVH